MIDFPPFESADVVSPPSFLSKNTRMPTLKIFIAVANAIYG